MVYQGSKNRIAKYILPIILGNRQDNQAFVDVFVGGGNIIDKVGGIRIGNDINRYLIALFKHAVAGGNLPTHVSQEHYYEVKSHMNEFPDWYVGYVAFICSYMGKFFNGYCGLKCGRNYIRERRDNFVKQLPHLRGVEWCCGSYLDLQIPPNSVVYCDPPYIGTRGYKDNINHDEFWQWCRKQTAAGHKVFVSETTAPSDFSCVWEMTRTNALAPTTTHQLTERLFTL